MKLNQKLQSNYDKIPHGVSQPLIKAWSIDDVPILCLTFHSARYDHLTLRRLVAQVDDAVKQVPQVAGTTLIGGARREVRVLLDPAKLASRNLSPAGLIPMLQQANRQYVAGGLTSNNKEVVVETGGFLTSAEDVGNVVVGVFGGKPVYLRDVATIVDGAEEPSQYVFFGRGAPERAANCSRTAGQRPYRNNPPSRWPSPNGRAPTPLPSPTKCSKKLTRSKAASFPPTCRCPSRGITA